eukprot:2021578-Alexandrium_andersonii.AAC.1
MGGTSACKLFRCTCASALRNNDRQSPELKESPPSQQACCAGFREGLRCSQCATRNVQHVSIHAQTR